MTEQMKHSLNPEAAETPTGDPALPQTLVAQLRAMRAVIPAFTQLTSAQRKVLFVVAKNTDPDFVQATINGVGASPTAEQGIGSTPDELRLDTADAQAWTAVEDEAAAFLAGIVDANLIRRHRIGHKALAVYAICRGLSKLAEHAHLLPHVELMTRLNRFGKRKAKKPAAPAPAPATQSGA